MINFLRRFIQQTQSVWRFDEFGDVFTGARGPGPCLVLDTECRCHDVYWKYNTWNTRIGVGYFNRINFREITFRDFANFRHFREIKTRENVWDCWLAKLNPHEIFNIVFWVEKLFREFFGLRNLISRNLIRLKYNSSKRKHF